MVQGEKRRRQGADDEEEEEQEEAILERQEKQSKQERNTQPRPGAPPTSLHEKAQSLGFAVSLERACWVYNRSRVVGFSKPTEILSGPGSWVGLPPGFPLRASEPAPDMKNLVRRAASANEELSPGVPADNCPTDPGHERFACVSVAASRGGVFTVPPDAEVEGFSKPTQKKTDAVSRAVGPTLPQRGAAMRPWRNRVTSSTARPRTPAPCG